MPRPNSGNTSPSDFATKVRSGTAGGNRVDSGAPLGCGHASTAPIGTNGPNGERQGDAMLAVAPTGSLDANPQTLEVTMIAQVAS